MTQEGEGGVREAAEGTRLPPHAPQARSAGEGSTHRRTQEVREMLQATINMFHEIIDYKFSCYIYLNLLLPFQIFNKFTHSILRQFTHLYEWYLAVDSGGYLSTYNM